LAGCRHAVLDYYLPDQAKDTLRESRERLQRPYLHAVEMGYLFENEGRLDDAVAELVAAALGLDEEAKKYEAANRLRYLIQRGKVTTARVDEAFWWLLRRTGSVSADGVEYLQYLENTGRIDAAKDAIRKLLPQYADTTFAERAYDFAVRYGDDALAKASLDRLVAISGRDPAMLRRLVMYHENRRELNDADKVVTELADAPGVANQDNWQFAADYYWRTEQRERALEYYRRLAENAGADAISRWVVYAERCLDDKRPRRLSRRCKKSAAAGRSMFPPSTLWPAPMPCKATKRTWPSSINRF